ncbi:hypothetical protein ACP70R_032171 [Stipagrostis hirtigluma subsp. patula]
MCFHYLAAASGVALRWLNAARSAARQRPSSSQIGCMPEAVKLKVLNTISATVGTDITTNTSVGNGANVKWKCMFGFGLLVQSSLIHRLDHREQE